MKYWECKQLLKDIKKGIIEANNKADYTRVDQLKHQKRLIKKKLFEFNKLK